MRRLVWDRARNQSRDFERQITVNASQSSLESGQAIRNEELGGSNTIILVVVEVWPVRWVIQALVMFVPSVSLVWLF